MSDIQQKQKILIVDDVPTNITVLTEILMSTYKMICATNGRDAVRVASSSKPDLILLDIMMPDMDGYEVCRILKKNAITENIPIIFLTAKTEEEDETKGLEIGAVDYIAKPFSPVILKHKVRIHLELKQHRDHLEELVKERTLEIIKSNEQLHQEIQEKLVAQEALSEQRAYFAQLFENSPLAILLINTDGQIVDVNKGFENLFKIRVEDVKGQYNKHITVPEDLIAEHEILHKNILTGKTIHKETYRQDKSETLIPVSILGYPVRIEGKIVGLFIIYTDISERKEFEAQLKHQAFHDSLTGIPNRVLLLERLERALERSRRRDDYMFAVLLVDLDRFKSVNDSLGHLAGDTLLRKIAAQIKECIRTTDTVARLGGDEFAVLVEEYKDDDEVYAIARRIHSIAESHYIIEKNEVRSSASIGIVLDTSKYQKADDILRDADIAMYHAKESGKARYETFNKTMHKAALERLRMENELRKAIHNDNLVLYYQPILSIETHELIGFEALVRWVHPVRGIINPDKFIPIAEETGLIIPLGHIVIKEACRQLSEWQQKYPKVENLTMSVNISVKQFLQADLIDFIIETIHENNLNPNSLKVEITESLLMKKAKSMIDKLTMLKDLGIKVVLDDFGTGYSSLSYIQQFPIDNIKIDRSFIKRLDSEDESAEIVKTIISLSKNLGIDVVAEGVERVGQLDRLKLLKCDSVQGYYFSRPVDKYKALEFIKRYL